MTEDIAFASWEFIVFVLIVAKIKKNSLLLKKDLNLKKSNSRRQVRYMSLFLSLLYHKGNQSHRDVKYFSKASWVESDGTSM